jgi:hypothetical protein
MLQSKSIAVRSLSISVTLMLLFAALLVNTESSDAASKLKVTAGKKTICAEQNTKLTANQNVKWSVSNSRVAKLKVVNKKTVSVTGKKAGTVYIKAKAGKLSKKIRITVKPLVYTSTDYIGMGEYCNVFYKGIDGKVVYSSADESIATVSNKGLVYGLKAGETKVTVRSKTNKKIKGSVKIKVVAAKAGLITLNVDLSDPDRYPAEELGAYSDEHFFGASHSGSHYLRDVFDEQGSFPVAIGNGSRDRGDEEKRPARCFGQRKRCYESLYNN